MNVMTAVFVESALQGAQMYKELIMQDKELEKVIARKHMEEVFRQIDEDGNGEITVGEMELFLKDEDLTMYLEALQINADDARMLFRLLDRDGSSKVDMHEFIEGCSRIKGEAKSFDVHVLTMQIRTFLDRWSDFTQYVDDRFNTIDAACELSVTVR